MSEKGESLGDVLGISVRGTGTGTGTGTGDFGGKLIFNDFQ
jgi:hypothetical protein